MRLLASLILIAVAVTASPVRAGLGPDSKLVDPHWLTHDPQSQTVVDHSVWGDLLSRHLVDGADGVNLLRYGALVGADKQALDDYVAMLEATPVTSLNRDEQMAYWFNLYNALTVKIVAEHYPVKSIRKVLSGGWFSPGPWKRTLVTVEGRELSLDNIEHGIMRPIWEDPRIHYGVNCASIGCPNLAPVPFTADNLEALLDEGARAYVNDPRGAWFENGDLHASRIYSWFDEDFGGNEAGIIAHLKLYADDDLKARLEGVTDIDGYDYDWDLNDAPVE